MTTKEADRARHFAKECADLLKTTTDPKTLGTLLEQRNAWLRMADEFDGPARPRPMKET